MFLGSISLGAAPLAAQAQQVGRVFRVGYLSAPSRESVARGVDAFLRRLRELGWVEGENLVIEYRWAEGKIERLPELAADLVQRKVDVIVAPAGSAALAAKNATSSIPIVMIFPNDPVDQNDIEGIIVRVDDVTVTLTVLDPDDERSSARPRSEDAAPQRARLAAVEALLASSAP